ncbi:MAG: hypothetical protein EKK41_26080 [Hyphomicrobiales bacterium]|nr:MAG: hypothetical protein EKK41_26080 [Hyphomicrobiales bacterium]
MQAVALDAPSAADASGLKTDRLRVLVLARIAATSKGVARATVAEDLAPYVSHRLSPAQWRSVLDAQVAALVADGLVVATGVKLEATPAGQTRAGELLGAKVPLLAVWAQLRDERLMARVLGLEKETAKRLKQLGRPDGLRAAILQKAYHLKIKGVVTPSRLRAALAAVALDRAFGNKGRDGLGGKLGLSAKAGRTLAGQLALRPRDFGTDGRLVAALAAEQAGAVQTDMGSLQQAILRRYLEGSASVLAPAPVAQAKPRKKAARAKRRGRAEGQAIAAAPAAPAVPAPAPAAPVAPIMVSERPDLAGFGKTVRQLAVKDAQGWSGNRKTYISHIWRRLAQEHANWGLSEIEFKCMLAEAHRAGHVALANADLKDAASLKDVQDSAVVYKNAVFHFVRVEA